MKLYTAAISISLAGLMPCLSQGFINLDFENAVINTINTPPPYPPFNTVASNAIPGWTAYINGEPQQYIVYNDITLSAAMVGLEGTNSLAGTPGVQGKYFVGITGSRFTTPASAAIGQTGLVPVSASSILFWGTLGQI